MTYTAHPSRIEIYQDGTNDLAAVVECIDEGGASLDIRTCTSASDWLDLSAAILKALTDMHLTGDVP